MSNQTSIARPYAKALFQHACSTGQLADWSMWLHALDQLLSTDPLPAILKNPSVSCATQVEIILALVPALGLTPKVSTLDNVIRLLVANKRLFALSAIACQFDALRAEQEKTIEVSVCSFAPMTTGQVSRLSDALSQRLQRKVTLKQTVDPLLLGGAVIRANDLVIDGSVRGQLMKLGADLAA